MITALTVIVVVLIITMGVRDMVRFRGNLRLQLDNLVQARADREAELQRQLIDAQEENATLRAGNLVVQKAAEDDRALHKQAMDTLHRRMEEAEGRLRNLMAPGRGR